MDVILDCIFDKVFSKLDRGCLLARYKRRQLVDYLSTVILGSSGGDHQDGCRRAVLAALRFHSSSREDNGHICLLGKYHNVLYVAATLCFEWKLQDTEVVEQVLQDIFDCEKTFEKLFIGAIFGTRVTHLISGWKSDFRSREECVEAVKYFLEHASKVQLQFDFSGELTNFVDVPMDSYGKATPLRVATQAGQADVLEILLDYGATVTPEPPDIHTCALQPLLRRMNEFYQENAGDPVAPQFVSCLNLLIREFPMLPLLMAEPEDELLDSKDHKEELQPREMHSTIYSLVPVEYSGYRMVIII